MQSCWVVSKEKQGDEQRLCVRSLGSQAELHLYPPDLASVMQSPNPNLSCIFLFNLHHNLMRKRRHKGSHSFCHSVICLTTSYGAPTMSLTQMLRAQQESGNLLDTCGFVAEHAHSTTNTSRTQESGESRPHGAHNLERKADNEQINERDYLTIPKSNRGRGAGMRCAVCLRRGAEGRARVRSKGLRKPLGHDLRERERDALTLESTVWNQLQQRLLWVSYY